MNIITFTVLFLLFILVCLLICWLLKNKKLHKFIKMRMLRFGGILGPKQKASVSTKANMQKPELIGRMNVQEDMHKNYFQPKPKKSVLKVPKIPISALPNTTTSMLNTLEDTPRAPDGKLISSERLRLEDVIEKDMSKTQSFNLRNVDFGNFSIDSESFNNSKMKPTDGFEIEYASHKPNRGNKEPNLKPPDDIDSAEIEYD